MGKLQKIKRHCKHHGETWFYDRTNGGPRCMKCNTAAVTASRRKMREKLIERAGGKCIECGYSTYSGALEFHHLDPSQKDFTINMAVKYGWDKCLIEIEKCVLLCANCHREVHAGIRTVG